MLYPLVPKNDGNQSLLLLIVLLPPSLSTTPLLSLKKAFRAYKYAPLPSRCQFLPAIPFPRPPVDRPPLAPPRRAIAPPLHPRARFQRRGAHRPAGSLSPLRRSDRAPRGRGGDNVACLSYLLKLRKIIIDVMAFRNLACTPQVIDLALERAQTLGDNGDVSDQGAQHVVRVVGNATSFGLSDMRSYYGVNMNHQPQPVHNPPPNLGVDSGFVFPSTMHNPCISSTSMNRYSSHAQSFGPGNVSLPINQVPSSMDESGANYIVGESARGHIKRKNSLVAGSYHFANGFAGSSSSSHAPQNHALRPWDPSFDSNISHNIVPFNPSEYHSHNGWLSREGSSISGNNGFNSMVHPEPAPRGNYSIPATHVGHPWMSQAATGVSDGIHYVNAASNAQGRFTHSGAGEMVNGGFHEYQSGPSTVCQGPVPYFHQRAMHSMQAHNLLDHTQIQLPFQQCHSNGVLHGGINYSANHLHLGPQVPVLFTNSERGFGPPQHPFLANPVNHQNTRILQPEHGMVMDFSRLYEVSNIVDEHRDMRLDIDSMTYEELLALEERIGDVNTGLSKSHIVDKLRTSLYVPGTSSVVDQSSKFSLESDACIICQEEYQDKDCIGTLDCGHRYHAQCVKQWLIVKNICPVCKTTALSADRRNGQ